MKKLSILGQQRDLDEIALDGLSSPVAASLDLTGSMMLIAPS